MKRAQATVLALLLVLGIIAGPALASDEVLGNWEATVETRRGDHKIVMEFTVSDDELLGTFTGRDGVETLQDVAYSDGTLTFTRNTESQGGVIALSYSATIDGDTTNVTVSTPRGERSFTAQRAPH